MQSAHGFYAKHASGFTLIELLISVGIIMLISGAMIPSFSNYSNTQNVRQSQEQVKNDLRTAQNNGLAGSATGSGTVNYWGISFTLGQNKYDYFTSDTQESCAAIDTVTSTSTQMQADSIIRSPNACVFFNVDNGDATAYGVAGGNCTGMDYCIVVGAPGTTGNKCGGVGINSAGLVKAFNDIACP